LELTVLESTKRVWECAERKTRNATGVDGAGIFWWLLALNGHKLSSAVAIMALIKSKTNNFPLSTVIIEQFRPPIGKYIVGKIVFCFLDFN